MGLIEKIAEDYSLLTRHSNGNSRSSLLKTRDDAFQAFTKLGIPSNRHEEWRYAHIKNKLPETLSLLQAPQSAAPKFHSFEGLKSHRLVVVNGSFRPELSSIALQDKVTLLSLKEAFAEKTDVVNRYFGKLVQFDQEHFATLNTAFATDGVFIHVEKGTKVDLPIIIVNITDNNGEWFTQSRNLIILEQETSASIVEDFQNAGALAYHNHASEFYLDNAASLQLTQLHTETHGTTGIYTTEIELQRDTVFNDTFLSLEGDLIRNNINARLKGQNAEVHLYGLFHGTGQSLIDNCIRIDHISPNCLSNQLYKGIMDDESVGVFNGKIYVKQDAQKTNAFQSAKILQLSDNASINTKPHLEIYADDVKCSHGAAIGQLNHNDLFYLMARGIEPNDARALLTYAFANDILNKIDLESLRAFAEERLKSRLSISF